MSQELEFRILGNIGEINVSYGDSTSLNVEVSNHTDSEYELYLSYAETRRIFCCKILTSNTFCSESKDRSRSKNSKETKLKVSLWKVLCLPFKLTDISVSNKSLWTIGKDYFVDIKSHIENVFKCQELNDGIEMEDDFMDIDANEEFQLHEFESNVNILDLLKHKFQGEAFCLKCNLIDSSIIICSKDLKTKSWLLDLIFPDHKSLHQDIKTIPLPALPFTYNEIAPNIDPYFRGGKINYSKPVITFIHKRNYTFQNTILHKLLDTDPALSSNSVCLVGHPEGKILYFLCSRVSHEQNVKVNTQLEELYDIRQPVVGIHFLEEIKGIEGNGFLLIVGAFGKLVLMAANQFLNSSDVIKLKTLAFHIAPFSFPTCVQKHIVFQDYIFHTSNNGDLWLSEFSKHTKENSNRKDINILQKSVIMHGISEIVLLDKLKGLFLVITKSGSLYLGEFAEKKSLMNMSSLPSLMNEIMHQSAVLQNLAFTASLQHKFFAALSRFASLKFNGFQECKVTCSVTEINEAGKKFLMDITIKHPEKFDSEFWFVMTSFYSHFQKRSAVISKSVPFISDQRISIEVEDLLLCPQHASPFPVCVEVGLLLTLPENLKSKDCFKLLARRLPLYSRIQTFILNELFFLKLKSQPTLSHNYPNAESSKSILLNIHDLAMSKPISNLLQFEQTFLADCRQRFTFYLLANSAQEIVNCNSSGSLLSDKVLQFLIQRSNVQNISEVGRLICRNRAITLLTSSSGNTICITLHADTFVMLAGLRMAIMELLLNSPRKPCTKSSQYISIPAYIHKRCEELSKDLLSMYGQDVEASGFSKKIPSMYDNLRAEVTGVLPFC